MDTGWAKLRYLERLLPPRELELVQWRNAARIFPRGAFPRLMRIDVNAFLGAYPYRRCPARRPTGCYKPWRAPGSTNRG